MIVASRRRRETFDEKKKKKKKKANRGRGGGAGGGEGEEEERGRRMIPSMTSTNLLAVCSEPGREVSQLFSNFNLWSATQWHMGTEKELSKAARQKKQQKKKAGKEEMKMPKLNARSFS